MTLAAPVWAGAGHDHGGHEHSARYGGIVSEVNHLSYELVAKPDSLTLYTSSHDTTPIATRGATAEGTLYAGNSKTPVVLLPAGENRFQAKGPFKVGVGTRIALTVTLAGKGPAKMTFNLK
ncbi:MAG: hypothetical protein D4R70_04285 [Betaproteobacteria bacterium]|nr:MAG: hypothetical protein D4R70_04285 [Betaproteobacteria bacterium]